MAVEHAEPRVSDSLLLDGSVAELSAGGGEAPSSARQLPMATPSGLRRLPRTGFATGGVLALTMVMGVHLVMERVGTRGSINAAAARIRVARAISTEEAEPEGREMLLIGEEDRGCYARGTAYWPLDMLGAIPLAASGAGDCQDRCAKKSGCRHFSFDYVSTVCHLEDASAQPHNQSLTFISGPAACPSTTSTATSTTATTATSVTRTTATATTSTAAATTAEAAAATTTGAPTRTTRAATTATSTTSPAPTTKAATTTRATTGAPTSTKPSTTLAPTASSVTEYLPTLFCFLILMPTGYEPDLVHAQVKKWAGVFSCKEYSAFSVAELDLGSGIVTTKIGGDQSKKGAWGSWLNTENFLQAWDSILAEGKFRRTDWTVKADPDCVFFPTRLQVHLQKLFPEGLDGASYYIKNCPKDFGFMGSLEVFSTRAIEAYGGKREECHEKLNPGGSGEDGYMQACMKYSGVEGKEDFGLLVDHYCGFGKCEGNKWNVAFHPFKDTNGWFQCWAQVNAVK